MGRGAIGAPLARLFANIIIMGSGVLGRHFLQAYKEALASKRPTASHAHAYISAASRALVVPCAHAQLPLPFFSRAQMAAPQQLGPRPVRREKR